MSEIKLEDINSLIIEPDKNQIDDNQRQSTSKMINQSSNENGQPATNNVQKSKDKTDKEITNLTSIILSEKDPTLSKCDEIIFY